MSSILSLRSAFFSLFALFLLAPACAPAPSPLRIRANDPSSYGALAPGQAMIVEFKEGDTVPLSFVVQGQFIETPPGMAPIQLVAKRKFFVRLLGNDTQIGLDGEHFGETKIAPGSFSVGFGVEKDGPKASVIITTPTHKL